MIPLVAATLPLGPARRLKDYTVDTVAGVAGVAAVLGMAVSLGVPRLWPWGG